MPIRTLLAAFALAAAFPVLAQPFSPPPEVVALRTEIGALELDRALALTPEQARALLPILQKGAADAKAIRARLETADPALVAALTRARDELRAGSPVSQGTRDAILAARKGTFGTLRGEFQGVRKQILSVLTPTQVEALRSARLGVGMEMGEGPGQPEGGRGRGPWHRLVLARAMLSDPFLALVQARAR